MSRRPACLEREDLAALRRYREQLRAAGRLLEATVVGRCIELLRVRARAARAQPVDRHP